MASLPIPRETADITPDWLNRVLPEDARGGASVTEIDSIIIGEGVGFLGELARMKLTYDLQPGGVPSLIAKVPTANEGFRNIANAFGFYARENAFYDTVGASAAVRVPHPYYLDANEETRDYVILLEDLQTMRPGNQLASCTLGEARLALSEIAKLHAQWWNSPTLSTFDWLPGQGHEVFDALEAVYRHALTVFPEVFGHLVTPEIIELVGIIGERYKDMIAIVSDRNLSLIHGDFRLDNMMFGVAGTDPFALLDWQLPFHSTPLWDVVYFLGGNFEPQWRRKHQDRLLRHYHSELLSHGIKGYSLADCRADYRAAGLVLSGYLVTGANDIDVTTLNDRGRELIDTMFSRYATTILDLESGDLIR